MPFQLPQRQMPQQPGIPQFMQMLGGQQPQGQINPSAMQLAQFLMNDPSFSGQIPGMGTGMPFGLPMMLPGMSPAPPRAGMQGPAPGGGAMMGGAAGGGAPMFGNIDWFRKSAGEK